MYRIGQTLREVCISELDLLFLVVATLYSLLMQSGLQVSIYTHAVYIVMYTQHKDRTF